MREEEDIQCVMGELDRLLHFIPAGRYCAFRVFCVFIYRG
jgi:hypothetical protein